MKKEQEQAVNRHERDFMSEIDRMRTRAPYTVFSDFCVMASDSLYSWKRDAAIEKEYADRAKVYDSAEMAGFSRMLASCVMALEEQPTDFLGQVYMRGEFHSQRRGQFFTPFNVSLMMARMLVGTAKDTGRIITFSEPCCGAGGMLIAVVRCLMETGIDWQRNTLLHGADIDDMCARMTFIQLSLLGVPAIIERCDSLTNEVYWRRETIGYHMAGMDTRLRIEKAWDLLIDVSKGKDEAVDKDNKPPPTDGQGMLF